MKKELVSISDLTCCPHCGSDKGYFAKDYAFGRVLTYYSFDGSQVDNSEMYQSLTYKNGKFLYCYACRKRIVKAT